MPRRTLLTGDGRLRFTRLWPSRRIRWVPSADVPSGRRQTPPQFDQCEATRCSLFLNPLAARAALLERPIQIPVDFGPQPTFNPEAMRQRRPRSEEHTSELQSHHDLVCRLLLEKK